MLARWLLPIAALLLIQTTGALAQSYREAEVEFARGQLMYEMKDYSRAIFSCKKAYGILPDARFLAPLAKACLAKGDLEGALVYGELYLEKTSDNRDEEVVKLVQRLRSEYAADKGKLVVSVSPVGGRLVLAAESGNIEMTVTQPTLIRWMPLGKTRVAYEREGFEPFSGEVAIGRDEAANISVALEREAGRAELQVESIPSGAVVFVDGDEKGTTPLKAEVDSGDHIVQVWAKDHMAWSGVVDAPAGKSVAVKATLARSEGSAASMPKQVFEIESSGGGWTTGTWGWIVMGLGLACGGGAGYFYYEMFSASDELNSLPDGDSRIGQLEQDVQTSWLTAVILGSVAGGLVGGGLLMVLMDDSGNSEEAAPFELLAVEPLLGPDSAGFSAVWSF